jgi:glutamyl-Q tRNA(Asp) synthetase
MNDLDSTGGGTVRTRFAPSPTGLLHLGHAHSALAGWHRARAAGGQFLLRLEDIDPGRCRPAFAQAVLDDLAWLGLDWDGPVRVQSAHLAQYRRTLDSLEALGLLYPCFCSRADIMASASAPHRAPDGAALYPGTCRRLDPGLRAARRASGEAHALRLDMVRACRLAGPLNRLELGQGRIACVPERFGDVVLARKEVPASYHLCVTHDDALADVTLVTRGLDLEPCTDLHRLLQALMGWPAPAYAHHALLRDADGRRLAKRDGAVSLAALRERGVSPAEIRAMAGYA